jgi:hypothetical protein
LRHSAPVKGSVHASWDAGSAIISYVRLSGVAGLAELDG